MTMTTQNVVDESWWIIPMVTCMTDFGCMMFPGGSHYFQVICLHTHTHTQNPETGGSGGSRFSLKVLSTKLRGGDTSYFARMAQATRELQESEDNLKQAQKDFE